MNTQTETTAPVTKQDASNKSEEVKKPNGAAAPAEAPKEAKDESKGKPKKASKDKTEAKAETKKGKKAKAAEKADKPKKAKAAEKGKAKPAKAADKADKPKKQPVERDRWGFKANSLKSRAASMYSSRKTWGATLNEVKQELKSSQLNLIKELENADHKVFRTKEAGKGKKPVTRYFLVHKDDKDTLKAFKDRKVAKTEKVAKSKGEDKQSKKSKKDKKAEKKKAA